MEHLENLDLTHFVKIIKETYQQFEEKFQLQIDDQLIHEDLLDRMTLNEEQVLKQRFDWLAIPGTKKEDFKERILKIGDQSVIAGIRHFSANKNFPFVSIIPDFSFSSEQHLIKECISMVQREFAVFAPQKISFYDRPKINFAIPHTIRQQEIVGNISKIRALEDLPKQDQIRFEVVKDQSYREYYEKLYHDFHQRRPDLKYRVCMNDRSYMDQNIEQGTLFYVYINDECAGFVAGERTKYLGYQGFYVSEIVLEHRYLGQGFAPAIQRYLLKNYLHDEQLIWGTIDFENQPSTRMALKVGREVVRSEYFFEIK